MLYFYRNGQTNIPAQVTKRVFSIVYCVVIWAHHVDNQGFFLEFFFCLPQLKPHNVSSAEDNGGQDLHFHILQATSSAFGRNLCQVRNYRQLEGGHFSRVHTLRPKENTSANLRITTRYSMFTC